MTDQEVLNSPFNMETHKKTFINYLEVVILENGTIEYAVPSHSKKLEKMVCEKHNLKWNDDYLNSFELYAHYTKLIKNHNIYMDWLDWLMTESGCILVWANKYEGKPNEKQLAKLKKLKDYGLYEGEIYD